MTKIALVTGAGSGVGKTTSLALAAAGWTVVLAGRRKDALEAVAAQIATTGARALPVPTDVTNEDSVRALFDTIVKTYGRLDFLFNNAGANTPPVPIEELTLENWRKLIDTNTTGVFLCLREAFRVMKAQTPRGGRIVNNGSVSAQVPRPLSIAYTASKHAVLGITKTAALDGRGFDIAVGQIDIGNAATDMATRQAVGALQANGTVAIEPLIDASIIANAVVHMASLPLDANVMQMTVMATKMPLAGRG